MSEEKYNVNFLSCKAATADRTDPIVPCRSYRLNELRLCKDIKTVGKPMRAFDLALVHRVPIVQGSRLE